MVDAPASATWPPPGGRWQVEQACPGARRVALRWIAMSAVVEHPTPYDAVVLPWADGPDIVEFPGGRRIRGRGLRHPLSDGPEPEFGVYLLARDPGPFAWDHRWVRWPDFRTPTSTCDAIAALAEAYRRSASERVELACGGGVGRTGTALAAIAVFAGVPRPEAVAWVRCRYNRRAVETPWQRRWVLKVDLAD